MNTPLGWLTAFHTLISLVATIVGFWAIRDLMIGRHRSGALTTFLWTAVITSVTGFFFPFHGVTPAIVVGVTREASVGDRTVGDRTVAG